MLAQAPTALWGKSVQTAKTTGGSDIQMALDGGLYVIGNASTRTEEEFVTLGSNNIAPGSLYRGTNENSSVQMVFPALTGYRRLTMPSAITSVL